jgi:shikimate kinase
MQDLQGKPIFLIGYRGTGKSTVARELAARLDYGWADSDEMVETRAGKTIAAIFASAGEPAFRDLEEREANRAAIRAAGPIVWLTASVETMLQRIESDVATASRRPNLTAGGGRGEVEALLALRTPLYRECATLVVDTEGKGWGELADEIVARL